MPPSCSADRACGRSGRSGGWKAGQRRAAGRSNCASPCCWSSSFGAIAETWGGSQLVAGFVAGIVLARMREPSRLATQLSGLADGFLVPAFFVLLGARLDLRALAGDPGALAFMVP